MLGLRLFALCHKKCILSYQGLRLSKGRYDETFAGEDVKNVQNMEPVQNCMCSIVCAFSKQQPHA